MERVFILQGYAVCIDYLLHYDFVWSVHQEGQLIIANEFRFSHCDPDMLRAWSMLQWLWSALCIMSLVTKTCIQERKPAAGT